MTERQEQVRINTSQGELHWKNRASKWKWGAIATGVLLTIMTIMAVRNKIEPVHGVAKWIRGMMSDILNIEDDSPSDASGLLDQIDRELDGMPAGQQMFRKAREEAQSGRLSAAPVSSDQASTSSAESEASSHPGLVSSLAGTNLSERYTDGHFEIDADNTERRFLFPALRHPHDEWHLRYGSAEWVAVNERYTDGRPVYRDPLASSPAGSASVRRYQAVVLNRETGKTSEVLTIENDLPQR